MISLYQIEKNFGTQVLFRDVNFQLGQGERVGILGRNGSGKSTLFKMVAGEESPDKGEVIFPKNYQVGVLTQHIRFTRPTVLEETCLGLPEARKDNIWEAEKTLSGLGFSEEDFHRSPEEFSGGFQIRINLAKVLISEPDLLLLDEPTNFLDIISIRWLRKFLLRWKGELMIISHDRSFMDEICTHTLVIHRQQIRKMEGDSARAFGQIELEEEVHEKTRENEEKKRKKQEEYISRFRAKARMAGMVQSRIKALEKQEVLQKLDAVDSLEFRFRFQEFAARYLFTCHNLHFGYEPGSQLITGFSMNMAPGDRVAIIGKNGKGKTTLLKLLAGQLDPQAGSLKYHPLLKVGYYGQMNVERLDPEKTVEEEMLSADPDSDRRRSRAICGAMMFEGDKALKKIKVLSGGEKSRVCLGKMLLSPSHLLLLDEPTNHLDAESCDALKNALSSFPGAVILVTHNEDFLFSVPQKLVVFDGQKHFDFPYSYHHFLKDVGWESETRIKAKAPSPAATGPKANPKELKRQRAEKVKMRAQALKAITLKIRDIEVEISRVESGLVACQEELMEAYEGSDGGKISDLSQRQHNLDTELTALYKKLEEVMVEEEETKKRFAD